MIEIGSVIPAQITRVEPYGVYMQYDSERVIVLLPEVSWHDQSDLRDCFRIGETVSVKILRLNYKSGEFVGSIRRLNPEENPYRQLSRLPPGTVLQGTVTAVYHGQGASVRLTNGTRGNIPSHQLKEKELKPGTELDVVIDALEVDEGQLTVRVHRPDEPLPGQPVTSMLAETHR